MEKRVGGDVKRVGGDVKWGKCYDKHYGGSSKILKKEPWFFLYDMISSIPFLSIYPKIKIKSGSWCLQSHVHCSISHSNQDKETTKCLRDKWIIKMWYIHTVEFYLAFI